MKKSTWIIALLMFSCMATAQDSVTIAKILPYAEGVGSAAVRTECDWNTQFSTFLAEFAKSGVTVSSTDIEQAQGKVLFMTVTHVHTAGGGAYSGPKWATIRGELRDGANVIGSFYANRTTSTGSLSACSALNRVGKAIAKDISIWLKAPSIDAKLGNAR